MAFEFTRCTIVPAPPEEVFDASLNVDFHLESFASTGEQVIGGIEGGVMADGDTVTWRAKHFGLWWRLTSGITDYDRPTRFVDHQIKGPFADFWHEHRFLPHPRGTEMHDHVRGAAPLGPLGLVAEALFVRRRMEALIDLRNEQLVAFMQTTRA